MGTKISDYINSVPDQRTRRALQAVFEDLGALIADDSLKQKSDDRQYTLEEFETRPVVSTAASGGGIATGATGNENLMVFEDNSFEYHILGTQTILAPVLTTTGLDIGMDQTDNDGVEITQGITSKSRSAFVVGTAKSFFFEATLKVADISGTDDCAVGFRKAEAYQANIDDYDELACLNVISGTVKQETILNNAATTTTANTDTLADGGTVILRVEVDYNGLVTFLIDGVAPTVAQTSAFSFDADEVVVPFVYFLQAATSPGACTISKWEVGLL